MEALWLTESAVTLHERKPCGGVERRELALQSLDVTLQRRRQVGVQHGGAAPDDVAHERRDLVRDGHLGETYAARDQGRFPLVLRVTPAVQEDNGGCAQSAGVRARELASQRCGIERHYDLARRVD